MPSTQTIEAAARLSQTPTLVALKQLEVAEENVRAGRPEAEDVDALAANIAEYGLISPLVGYKKGARYMIVAGRRRLAALRKIKATTAPVIVCEREEAAALSLAENEQRVEMHPADQARAFARMIESDGRDITEVANAFGVTERYVRQRMALASLHPPIFERFAADKIDLETAEAWANASPETQAALFKRLGADARVWEIRRELRTGKLEARDRLCRFVGEEAYRAAGGRIEQDLFGEFDDDDLFDDDEEGEAAPPPPPPAYWLDVELVNKLAAEKLQAEADRLKAEEGWGFVVTGDRVWEDYQRGPAPKSKAERAKKGAHLSISFDGTLDIERGMIPRKGAAKRADKVEALAGEAPKAPPPPITNSAHHALTLAASAMAGRALLNKPMTAVIALAAQLARAHWDVREGDGYGSKGIIRLSPDHSRADHGDVELASDAERKAVDEALRRRLSKSWANLEQELNDWTEADVLFLFAFLIGELIDATEQGAGVKNSLKRRKLAFIAAAAELDPAAHWSPTKEWLMGLSREELAKLAAAVGVEATDKKGQTAEAIAAAAKAQAFVPPQLAELMGSAFKQAAPKKRARKGGAA